MVNRGNFSTYSSLVSPVSGPNQTVLYMQIKFVNFLSGWNAYKVDQILTRNCSFVSAVLRASRHTPCWSDDLDCFSRSRCLFVCNVSNLVSEGQTPDLFSFMFLNRSVAVDWLINSFSFVLLVNVLEHTDRICVVDEALASCLNMVADTNALNLEYECVRARDRYRSHLILLSPAFW